MSDPKDIHGLAGEYVIGTLDEKERQVVDRRRKDEPDLETEIQSWEGWLLPIADTMPAVSPSPKVWESLVKRLFGVDLNQVVVIVRRAQRWRGMAIAASLLAILSLGSNLYLMQAPSRTDIATLQKDSTTMFVVSMNEKDHSLTVHMNGGDMPKDKSYELWLIMDKNASPQPMGVLTAPMTVLRPDMSKYSLNDVMHATLAISMEPMGGSPTGLPTGEVISTGKFLAG